MIYKAKIHTDFRTGDWDIVFPDGIETKFGTKKSLHLTEERLDDHFRDPEPSTQEIGEDGIY